MAKFKNKIIGTKKRERDVTKIGDAQLEKINKRVRRIEYRDLFFSILFIILVVCVLSALIYAAIALVRGYIL